ncbi:MAG: hypothetical protein Q4C70_05020 [Planctomycetia bacterium]|nr:hypothetical protein [Planctomycetia bacterium]
MSKEAQKKIIDKSREYIENVFYYMDKVDFRYFDGAFRGYIHGLGDAGVIPRQTEYNICKIDFREDKRSLRRFYVSVRQQLQDGFREIETGQINGFDKLYKEILEDED